jgi:hypothetical protein
VEHADDELVELGKQELDRMGLVNSADIIDGCVFRVEKSYPVYDSTYREHLARIRGFIASLDNLVTIGRNGLHRYNNQDHAMLTGMFAVRNLILGEQHDLWNVNAEGEYHEEIRETKVREVVRRGLSEGFPKLDPVALGTALGLTGGLTLLLATLFLVLRDGPGAGPTLWLLANVFPLYEVSIGGSFIGFIYAFVVGFVMGWGFASIRNISILLSLAALERRVKMELFWKSLY